MFNATTKGKQMHEYRVMVEYKIQSQIAYIWAESEQGALIEARHVAPNAERVYVLEEIA
jgi:hypothetical protein